MEPLVEQLCKSLYYAQYHYHSEKELQQGVQIVLAGMGLSFQSEYRLAPCDRIDFLVDNIGIECKSDDSKGGTSLASVTRQLMRYAQSPEISHLILLTTMSKHKVLPESLNGKPLYVVHLLLSFL